MRRLLPMALAVLVSLFGFAVPASAAVTRYEGSIDGAAYRVMVPSNNTADGLLPISGENAYGQRVVRKENLRQLAVDRAGHCRFTSSEEVTAFEALFTRLDTGSWPATDPALLNAAATLHPPERQTISNPLTGGTVQVRPAFTTHPTSLPPRALPC
ncbi:hypothetical protein ACQPW3_38160 [Actinosynnema sp. CA-248983]